MRITFFIISIITFLFVICGCDFQLKSSIDNYKGDGEINYLELPGLFGASGCSITMPSFDLSKDFEETYSLFGTPANDQYVVYLVIKEPADFEQIKKGHFSYQIREGNKIIRNISAPLEDYTIQQGGGFNKFYFFNIQLPQAIKTYVSLGSSDLPTVIEIKSQNKTLTNSKQGYLEIRFGGFK